MKNSFLFFYQYSMSSSIIYKDKNIEVKAKTDLSIHNMPIVAMSCIEAGLIGMKWYCFLAKNPLELRKLCKEDIEKSIQILEEILSNTK